MPHINPDQRIAREALCRFLAACYYEPGPEFAEQKVFESMIDAASRIDAHLAAHAHRMGEAFSEAGADRLLIDYTQLFLGPVHILAKPYGSVWLDGEKSLMQDSTMRVLDLYEEAGFEMDEQFRELPDHIAAELEFLYLLIYQENQAHHCGDSQAAAAAAGLRERFLSEHLGAWIKPFTVAVKAGAHCPFYRELAALTDRFVGMEAQARDTA